MGLFWGDPKCAYNQCTYPGIHSEVPLFQNTCQIVKSVDKKAWEWTNCASKTSGRPIP